MIEVLAGYGTKIDLRNLQAIKHNVIKNRLSGNGGLNELILEMCRLITSGYYAPLILRKLEKEISYGKAHFFKLYDDTIYTVSKLSENKNSLGIISNQERGAINILESNGLESYFEFAVYSSDLRLKKSNLKLFKYAIERANKIPSECIMVGDRLDLDIFPANRLGMKTIRVTNSLFELQQPISDLEIPNYTVSNLADILPIIKRLETDSPE
jgi:HAD superfamily hydrolase (TIGR01549 family)